MPSLDGKTCTSFSKFSGGDLNCTSGCLFDYGKCIEKNETPRCGDNKIDPGEVCDNNNLDNKDCKSFGYIEGTLSCIKETCKAFNSSNCVKPPPCGNGAIDAGEQCDDKGNVFGAINSCKIYTNFIGGNLGCNNCQIDTTDCIIQKYCGDGIIQQGEHCETNGNLFGSAKTCSDLGFASGQLSCTQNCFLDTSKCVPKSKCGNGLVDPSEECDSNNLGPLSGQCTQYSKSFTGGTLKCSNNCKIEKSSCAGVTGTCNNGFINIGEACDGNLFGNISDCKGYTDFSGGLLKCRNCNLDTSSCVPSDKCGNRLIDPTEECDSSNLGSINTICALYSRFFTSGTINCNSDCKLDTFGCIEAPKCGNSVIDSGETCDGANFGNFTDLSCSSYNSNFVSGALNCSVSCQISTRNCMTNATTTVVTCRDRGDCGLNVSCNDNSECRSRFCLRNKCAEPSCNDGIKNQGESSIDCGMQCDKCANDKTCNRNSDCQSNFCSLGLLCKPQEACSDGKLGLTETDIDCGGSCPTKCPEGKSCSTSQDCVDDLECASFICKKKEVVAKTVVDSDGDGIPDDWEIEHGLNPNDPSDAGLDPDKDGLTNFEEYQVINTYSRSTDPQNSDTDGDGFSDKEELDKGTSPVDPEDFPKSSLTKIILFILGIIILLSGFGYLGYRAVLKRKEEKYGFKKAGETPTLAPQPRFRPVPLRPSEAIRIKEALKRKEALKGMERKKLFEAFGKEEKEKPKEAAKEIKVEKPGSKVIKEELVLKVPKKKAKRKTKKPKEDVFLKLKEIAKESKKKKHQKARKSK